MEADPLLSDLKMVSEPWDCGGLYRLNDFPAQRIGTWNGRFRDALRGFWKGDEDSTWAMGQRLRGSPDLYEGKPVNLGRSVNLLTAHDGFTLMDLVSFNGKHNLANGEDNRDGENHNISWNHGVEGPSTDHAVTALRRRQQRNMLSTLLLARGVPMLLMGDEVGRSQGGNNNTWCQDTPLSWMIWSDDHCDMELFTYVKRLLVVRRQLADLFNPLVGHSEKLQRFSSDTDGYWRQWHGVELGKPDWASWSHCLALSVHKGNQGAVLWAGLNAYFKAMHFDLPEATTSWHRLIDTALPPGQDLPAHPEPWTPPGVPLEARSLVVMVAGEYANSLRL